MVKPSTKDPAKVNGSVPHKNLEGDPTTASCVLGAGAGRGGCPALRMKDKLAQVGNWAGFTYASAVRTPLKPMRPSPPPSQDLWAYRPHSGSLPESMTEDPDYIVHGVGKSSWT